MSIDARMDLIGIVVADMAASLAFYRRLGLDLPADADDGAAGPTGTAVIRDTPCHTGRRRPVPPMTSTT